MRIQILPLPSVMVGDDMDEPFALIVDQHDSAVDEQTAEEWQRFKTNSGARALLVTPDTVEVVDRYAETPAQEATSKATPVLARPQLKLDPIVLLDGNGNPMNMWASCSCGVAMSFDLAASWREKTAVICRSCGNRLTVTVSAGSQA